MNNPSPDDQNRQMDAAVRQVNAALQDYSDKDWNYSRISLTIRGLDELDSPYILRLETLDLKTKQGRTDLKTLSDEVKWGERHTSELGMLEVVSLRLNKALLEITSDEHWQFKRPVVRIVKKEVPAVQQDNYAIWYQIDEVAGDDFDNR
ncbi:MAG TPA: hypothetical protein VNL17_15735 [Verrucomicrobiae bacterium]|nr:hypothetical protein [Verrucomicrobiae bacterium]